MTPVYSDRSPRLFNIASGTVFLTTLADAFLSGALIDGLEPLEDPLAMSSATIFLPTRRAVKSFSTLLAERSGHKTLLLPRIIALGDSSETEDNLLLHLPAGDDQASLLTEADPLFRTLTLAQLIMQWKAAIQTHILTSRPEPHTSASPLSPRHLEALQKDDRPFIPATTPHDALALAQALGHLIDTLAIHDKTFEDLNQEIPSELAEHWQITQSFLQIAVKEWPNICAEHALQDSAHRRHLLLKREAQRLREMRPDTPVIVAGSTGSMPATAELIRAIAFLPRGCVVLPGFDTQMDEDSWQHLVAGEEPSHPQHLLARLVKFIGADRHAILSLGAPHPALKWRERLIQEAMRPAITTHEWARRNERLPQDAVLDAISSMTLIEAEDEREEALAIALCLREQLETDTGTAALITPDRGLAERVMRELARWSIHVEDSSGLPLRRAPAGRLLLLLADWLAKPEDPHRMLALLDHPFVLLGLSQDDKELGRSTLDVLATRGLLPDPTLDGLSAKLDTLSTDRLNPTQLDLYMRGRPAAQKILTTLKHILATFDASGDKHSLLQQSLTLETLLDPLCVDAQAVTLFDRANARSTGLRELATFFDDVHHIEGVDLKGRIDDLPGFVEGLLQGRLIPPDPDMHPRLRIWGLLEARLLPTDRIILGGCDEGVWPPVAETDAFLNRPMAKALGLPSPEQRLGQTAHDFCQALGVHDVILTRSSKRNGDPMVRSRFLQRLQAVIGKDATLLLRSRGQRFLDWARLLDTPLIALPQAQRPSPVPAPNLLPKKLSITEIATLRRDPYAIYARRILTIDPLEPVDRPVMASDLGSAIHDALGAFTQKHPVMLPLTAYDELLALGAQAFTPMRGEPEFEAFWWPRYQRIIKWFVDFETLQRADKSQIFAETSGRETITLAPTLSVDVHGRADRIEQHRDGTFSLYDFKTGRVPTANEIKAKLEPQLTITAALLQKGAFAKISNRTLRLFDYIKLGGDEGGKFSELPKKLNDSPLDDLVSQHWAGLQALIKAHWLEQRGFVSRLYPAHRGSFGTYDHLARVKEWALGEQEGDA